MVARDDSIIRGSLYGSLTFLALSVVLNFFMWRSMNLQSIESERGTTQLANANDALRKMTSQSELLKAMLGYGEVSEANLAVLRESVGGDADMEAIDRRYVQDMTYFGPEVDVSNRNYTELPEFLVNAIRTRNDQIDTRSTEVIEIRDQAANDVDAARKAQDEAEKNRDNQIAKLEKATQEFTEDRDKMRKTGEDMKDKLVQNVTSFEKFRKVASDEKAKLTTEQSTLKGTIENQRQELTRLRSDKFETVQGEIQTVIPPGDLVLINLGSSDALRAGVQFGVIAADTINLQDAPIKATIEVIKVVNANSSQARVLGKPSYRDPLIAGDKIYSPFWAPGRKVKIALAGDIDIDGDGRTDSAQLQSMIELAGAEVAAVISKSGAVEGQLDASIRFLVIGEVPEINDEGNPASERDAQYLVQLGRIKAEAVEKGITVIPAWKLQAYLKTINDSVTTPLGSAVRGDDFPPEAIRSSSGRANSSGLPEMYRNQIEGQ